jgi:threonine/homoserine/homoserine lactone efflux protein
MTFLPDLATLVAFTLASAVLIITPGPDMTYFVGQALTRGRAAGIAAALGASAGAMVHVTLAALGVSALLAASATAFQILKIAGALYLLWLATQALRGGSAFSPRGEEGARPVSLRRIWAQGVGINLLNPKVVIFFLTLLPQFVAAGDPAARWKLLTLGAWFVVMATFGCIGLVLCAGGFAGFMRGSPRAMRVFDWIYAGVLGAFAVKLLTTRATAS